MPEGRRWAVCMRKCGPWVRPASLRWAICCAGSQCCCASGNRGLGAIGFRPFRVCLLAHPGAAPGRTSAELARDTHVTAQAANQLLHRLEALGAVSRPVTPASGRSLPAELTPEGKSLLARAERAVEKVDDHVLAGLTPAQQRQLKALLAKAVGNQARTDCGPIVISDPPQ